MKEFVLFGYMSYVLAGRKIIADTKGVDTYDVVGKNLSFSERYLKTAGLAKGKINGKQVVLTRFGMVVNE